MGAGPGEALKSPSRAARRCSRCARSRKERADRAPAGARAWGPREVSSRSGRAAGGSGAAAAAGPWLPGRRPRAGLPPGGRDAARRRSVGVQLPSVCLGCGRSIPLTRGVSEPLRNGAGIRGGASPLSPAPAQPLPRPGGTRRPAALLPAPSVAPSLGWLWCREKQTLVAGC